MTRVMAHRNHKIWITKPTFEGGCWTWGTDIEDGVFVAGSEDAAIVSAITRVDEYVDSLNEDDAGCSYNILFELGGREMISNDNGAYAHVPETPIENPGAVCWFNSIEAAYEDMKDRVELVPQLITEEWLDKHPKYVFVFGDNTLHSGYGGAAVLRDHPSSYGFITKRYPRNNDEDFFTPEAYMPIFLEEVKRLYNTANNHPDKVYLISKLGAGLANRFKIFEKVIEPSIKGLLSSLDNVKFLW